MRKQFNMQEAKTKTQVDMAYREYQQFMQTSNMPSYIFQYIKQNGTTIAEERYENNEYNLIIADTLCTTYKENAKSILFHEFTHIFDEEELVKTYGFSHDDRNTPYVYKEIHAEQIRTLYLLGCKTVNDIENIDKDRVTFSFKKKSYNIYDYIMEYKKELLENIKIIELARTTGYKIAMQEFSNILTRIFCYIATSSVYLKYCDNDVYDDIDIQPVYDYYNYGLNTFLKECVKNPIGYHTKELVEAMGKWRMLVFVHFGKDMELIDFK